MNGRSYMGNWVIDIRLSKVTVELCLAFAAMLSPFEVEAQATAIQSSAGDDSDVRPIVAPADLLILKRARALLDSPSHWNRADNRKCPEGAKTFSIYCALEVATIEVAKDQQVITTGSYAVVRHPMYASALIYLFLVVILRAAYILVLLW